MGRVRLLTAFGALFVLLACTPAPAAAGVLPGLERETAGLGCPLGFALLPGTVCPASDQISPLEAEQDAAAVPRPPGPEVRARPAPYAPLRNSGVITCRIVSPANPSVMNSSRS